MATPAITESNLKAFPLFTAQEKKNQQAIEISQQTRLTYDNESRCLETFSTLEDKTIEVLTV